MNYLNVKSGEVNISYDEFIGTKGLTTCVGYILYDKEDMVAIVGHVSNSFSVSTIGNNSLHPYFHNLYYLICDNELMYKNFDLKIIEGASKSVEEFEYNKEFTDYIVEQLKRIKIININSIDMEISDECYQIVDKEGNECLNPNLENSKQFAFDPKTGQFVTKLVSFDQENKTI